MCKVCQKIEFVIDTIEQLYSLEDWKKFLLEVKPGEEVEAIIRDDDRNVWCNMISLICVVWMYKKHIPFTAAHNTLIMHLSHEYLDKDHDAHKEVDKPHGYES